MADNPYILPVILFLIGLAAVLATMELYRILRAENRRLREDLSSLQGRLTKLEEANPKRINVDSLENMESAMLEVAVMEMEIEQEYQLKKSRINKIREYQSKAHTPNGKTPK